MRPMVLTLIVALATFAAVQTSVAAPGAQELRQHNPCNPEIRKC